MASWSGDISAANSQARATVSRCAEQLPLSTADTYPGASTASDSVSYQL